MAVLRQEANSLIQRELMDPARSTWLCRELGGLTGEQLCELEWRLPKGTAKENAKQLSKLHERVLVEAYAISVAAPDEKQIEWRLLWEWVAKEPRLNISSAALSRSMSRLNARGLVIVWSTPHTEKPRAIAFSLSVVGHSVGKWLTENRPITVK